MLAARNRRGAIVAASACAVMLFPTLADAKRGDSPPKGKAPAAHAKGKAKPHAVAFQLKGTALAGDPCADEQGLSMKVTRSNRHGRGLVGSEVALDLSGARLKVADVNGDGSRTLDDVSAGDEVKVHARLPRGAAPAGTVAARQVIVKHRVPEPTEPTEPTDPTDPYGAGASAGPSGSEDPYGGGVDPCDPYGDGAPSDPGATS